jgi:hypothetical protein
MSGLIHRAGAWFAAVRESIWPRLEPEAQEDLAILREFPRPVERTAEDERLARASFARSAAALLQTPAYSEAVDRLLRAHVQSLIDTPAQAHHERERLYLQITAIRAVQTELSAMIAQEFGRQDARTRRMASS